jgi:transposase-like protein
VIQKAAKRFFDKAIENNGVPAKITIDKSGANKAAIKDYNVENNTEIEIRQIKYLNNLVEQDHRGIKRIVRPMLGFKEFHSAGVTLGGIELVRMIQKGQMENQDHLRQTTAEIFYSLAA